ncbi:putative surface layer protein [uncultured Eubacteriales bacterium]|uniref:Putative surface layer protein n=1 Tax=uncultured Eubacteriales bacterium TaxID=172733 RepID=A0A212KJJ4_9FIRM|nr:putative surface layer protein [uncultured Eubacteriales bacterium]
MKKVLSLVLAVAMMCALGVPAAAAGAESTDARLTAVTEKVKATLDLDTSVYTAFQGDLEDGTVTPVWQLQWTGEDGGLTISATEDGKILSYNVYDSSMNIISYPGRSGGATFPKLTRADAQKTAQSFLNKVLTAGVETATFEDGGAGGLSVTSHSFYGAVLENGLPSPFTFRVGVRVSDNTVTSFYLNGSQEDYLGGIPSATPAASSGAAGENLKSTLKLRLEYVLADDGKTAVLRYLPESVHDFYVDAQTGKLVDLTKLQEDLWNTTARAGGSPYATAESAVMDEKGGLSEVELAGIAQLEGVLSKEDLDAAARKISALGLSKYTLSTASYRVNQESGEVSATLQYAYKSGDSIYRRTVTLNGKTGDLISVYSSRPWNESEKATVSLTQAQSKAEAFLKAIAPAQFAETALYNTPDSESVVRAFQYAVKENGYFLPASSMTVEIDGTDGSVSAYYSYYVEGVTFESPEGIISADAALTAWFDTYDVTLGYLAVPEKLDLSQPEWKPLIEAGRNYLYTRKLAYYLERDGWYLGVDANSGEAVKSETVTESPITYSDLSGHWVKAQAEALAQYGVGWLGGSLKPAEELKQIDLVALLVSTSGYRYDPAQEGAADDLYQQAYYMGLLEKSERNDSAPVTRAQLTKLLLDNAGYGNVAGLKGIFKTTFTDEAQISDEYLGYAAVGQALGIVKGDKTGSFAPTRVSTRAEAVSMLYQFMSR